MGKIARVASAANRISIDADPYSNAFHITLGKKVFSLTKSDAGSISVNQRNGDSVTIRIGKHSATVKLSRAERAQVANLRTGSITTSEGTFHIKNPLFAVIAAKLTGVPLSVVLAQLDQESGGGKDIWGADAPPAGIFVEGGRYRNRRDPTETVVTQRAYDAYLRARGKANQLGAAAHEQGVGPTQLTYANLQNDADDLGGAYRPLPNLIVGFADVAALIRNYKAANPGSTSLETLVGALTSYNGVYHNADGSINHDYADGILGNASKWAQVLATGKSVG